AMSAPAAWMGPMAVGVELAFRMVFLLILGWALARPWKRLPGVIPALAAMVPFAVLALLELAGSRLLVEYRTEAIQLAITWFLAVSAYALNLRLGRLRRQRDEAQLLAETDPLTGLPNRRAGLRRLQEMFAAARREGTDLSVAFVDIDHFKSINDHHGHDAGGQVLVAAAQALRGAVRGASEAARMGGEEFLVLLPGVSAASAVQRMESLRSRLAARAGTLGFDGLVLTASIGVTSLRRDDTDAAALLRRADAAMYAAKRGGRDRVELADDRAAAPQLNAGRGRGAADEAQGPAAADNGAMTEEAVRLNKHIAGTGFCSRREADRLIAERRVTVNGQPAGVGAVVGEGDEVRVDGQPLKLRAAKPGKRRHVYIALNKPVGITCTTESSVKGNIVDFVGHEQRIFPIGRLDKDSEGLILLTSNGDIVNEILRA